MNQIAQTDKVSRFDWLPCLRRGIYFYYPQQILNYGIMKIQTLVLLFAFTAAFSSCNNSAQKDPVDAAEEANKDKDKSDAVAAADKDDANFLVEAASGGMMEVTLGKAAQTKSLNAEVKNFGNMMITDHSKANDELKTLAASKNITIPAAMGDEQQKMSDKMMEKSGADFDKDYMSMMIDDHKDDIDKFEKAADNCKDADIKAFAARTLPVLKKHLEAAIVIEDNLKKTK